MIKTKLIQIQKFIYFRLYFFLLLFIPSCTPIYVEMQQVPEEVLEEQVNEALKNPPFEISSQCSDDYICQEWWRIFHDPQLDSFIQQALEDHPTAQIAQERIALAAWKAREAKAALYPLITWNTDVMYERQSKTGIFGSVPAADFPFSYTQTESLINYSYEIDWWNKNKNAYRAAVDGYYATIADSAVADLSLSLSIAQIYFEFHIQSARATLANSIVENQKQYLDLIQQRVKQGLETEITKHNAENTVVSAQEVFLTTKQQATAAKFQLQALLSGNFNEEICPIPPEQTFLTTLTLPCDLPIDLLSYRPDITAQLWRIEASAKFVQVAQASFYPNVNMTGLDLTGFFGLQTITLSKFFESKSIYSSNGPALHLPIFDGGQTRVNIKEREEEFIIAVQEYNRLVLQAVEDVLEGLSNVQSTKNRYDEMKRMSIVYQEIYDLMIQRQKFNIASSLDVLAAKQQWLSSQDRLMISQLTYLTAVLKLIHSLGGAVGNKEICCEDT